MTEAEVAGCIQVKVLFGEVHINEWLQQNADLEIVDIKFSATAEEESVLIIYRKED